MDVADLIGTWELVEVVAELVDGTRIPAPWNQGYLIYGPDGTMSAILDNRDRKPPATLDEQTWTPADMAGVLDGRFAAYAGTYTLQGNVVTHHVRFAMNPARRGLDMQRSVRLEGGRLLISTRGLPLVVPRIYDLIWERAITHPSPAH